MHAWSWRCVSFRSFGRFTHCIRFHCSDVWKPEKPKLGTWDWNPGQIKRNLKNPNWFSCSIYTDIEKAFDKIPHTRLLLKFRNYNVHHSLINWIKCFWVTVCKMARAMLSDHCLSVWKLGALNPFGGRELGPHTSWPGPRPTSIHTLIYPAVWPQ